MRSGIRKLIVWLIGTVPGHQKKLRETQKRHSDKLNAAEKAKATMYRENRKASASVCATAVCPPAGPRDTAIHTRAAGA